MCFAQNMTVKDAAEKTGLSEPTVRGHFMRLRERLYQYGGIRVNRQESKGTMPARIVFSKKHRGVPEKYAHLYETEFLNRVLATRNTKFVRKYSPRKAADLKAIKKFMGYNKLTEKYRIIEVLQDAGSEDAPKVTREFDLSDYNLDSTIVVNELAIHPHEAFFRQIWALLLKHPL